MHELSIAVSIIEMVEEEMQSRGEARLVAVHVKLGALSGVVKEALLSSYEVACDQSSLAGSRLIVEEVPVLMNCPRCGDQQPVHSVQWLCCACCGSPAREIVQGRELLVSGLEVLE
ncbi:MAG: hydrogenase maturation nickel metallochaperone HypA [Candidatus Acidiferrales bacterium]